MAIEGNFASTGIAARIVGGPGAGETEFLVNTTTDGAQDNPQVAALAGGGFVVAWNGPAGIYAQRFAEGGAMHGSELRIDTATDRAAPGQVQVAGLAGGGFIAVWTKAVGGDGRIFGQAYDATGARVGGEIAVSTTTVHETYTPQITALQDGGALIGWSSHGFVDGLHPPGFYLQRLNADGSLQGGETLLFDSGGISSSDLSLTTLPGNEVLATWTAQLPSGDGLDIYAQHLVSADSLVGTELGELLQGDVGRNLIVGEGGNDTLIGLAGSDTLEGGAGSDYLYGDTFWPGLFPDEAASVYRLYQATLDRAPDLRGLTNWSERLFTGESGLQQVATGFVNSAEFQATYGALDDEGFVELLYQNVLGRAADAGGLANWTGQLADGTSRAEVVLGFSQSAEFTDSTAAEARAFANASSQAGWGDDVYRVYQATLDRAPDITGFSNWSGQLAGGRALDAVINGFVDSAEFQATYGALDDTAFVELLYQNVLDREADAGGLRVWTQQLAAGTSRAEVVRGFSQSAEFVAATAEDFKDWMRGLEHDAGDPYHDWLSGETGDNALAGGLFADVFDFEQEDGGSHLVLDLEAWDYVSLQGFGYADADAALLLMTQARGDVVYFDQGVEITFVGAQLADIAPNMILV